MFLRKRLRGSLCAMGNFLFIICQIEIRQQNSVSVKLRGIGGYDCKEDETSEPSKPTG